MLNGQDKDLKLKFSGFTDTYHAVRSQSPNDFMSSRSRLRTELEASKGKSYMFVSLNSIHNSVLEDQTGIELREAFLQHTTDNWDFKVGRQIVIWGVADGLRITDVVSPLDYTEFLARDYDDIRIPVNALKLKYFTSKISVEAIFIPVSSFFIVPTSVNNPWSVISTYDGIQTETNLDKYPDKTFSNSEYGGRASFYLSGVDISISALHTWNKFPIFESTTSSAYDTVFIHGQYNRMDMLGMDFSFPVGQFVMRGEAAEYFGELQETNSGERIERNTTNVLWGVDWYPGGEWNITAQYSHKLISDYVDILANKRNTVFATLGITKSTLRSTLKLSSFTYLDISNSGFFNRTSADYSLSDQIHLLAGYDWFHGDNGVFAIYKDNSEYWFKAKFNF